MDAKARSGRFSNRGLGRLREPWTRQGMWFHGEREESDALQRGISPAQELPCDPLSYGIVQNKGGPCGPLACIQAWCMSRLAIRDRWTDSMRSAAECAHATFAARAPGDSFLFQCTPLRVRQEACAEGIADMIWTCATETSNAKSIAAGSSSSKQPVAVLCIPSATRALRSPLASKPSVLAASDEHPTDERLDISTMKAAIPSDPCLEHLRALCCTSRKDLGNAIRCAWPALAAPTGLGLVSIVCSVMLTRGVLPFGDSARALHAESSSETSPTIEIPATSGGGCAGDFDQGLGAEGRMIGAHGYATQELVNLMLVGRAWSNTIDGTKTFGSGDEGGAASGQGGIVLHGPHRQSDIGFLSLHEHYGSVLVGERLKTPRLPVWVVCSESHYTCAWASSGLSKVANASSWKTADLHYWDGLIGQDEQIHFTLRNGSSADESHSLPSAGASASRAQSKSSAFSVEGILGLDDQPPLNLVLQTKWKQATVDWNGVDPWL